MIEIEASWLRCCKSELFVIIGEVPCAYKYFDTESNLAVVSRGTILGNQKIKVFADQFAKSVCENVESFLDYEVVTIEKDDSGIFAMGKAVLQSTRIRLDCCPWLDKYRTEKINCEWRLV